MLSMITNVNETANVSNIQKSREYHDNQSQSGCKINESIENLLVAQSPLKFTLRNQITLADGVRSKKLKEILSRMDSLPPPILGDLFTHLAIDSYERQQVGVFICFNFLVYLLQ